MRSVKLGMSDAVGSVTKHLSFKENHLFKMENKRTLGSQLKEIGTRKLVLRILKQKTPSVSGQKPHIQNGGTLCTEWPNFTFK
jgi:hypothetical protein